MTVLETDALDGLRAGFEGEIVEPGDASYDETRLVFNGMFDRRPAVILRPTDTAGVQAAITSRANRAHRSRSAPAAIRSPASRASTTASSSTCAT